MPGPIKHPLPDSQTIATKGATFAQRPRLPRLEIFKRPPAAMPVKRSSSPEQRIALLRTRIMREMREKNWNRLAVVPVTAGAGATTVALDLARMIARHQGTRVMLIDLDLGSPAIAERMQIEGCASYAETVRTGQDLAALLHVQPDSRNFAVLAPAAPDEHAAEFLQGLRLPNAMERLSKSDPAHIVLMDCAPLLGTDIGLAALPLADAVLLVADGTSTTAADIKECERLLVDMPPIMGVVLNKSEV